MLDTVINEKQSDQIVIKPRNLGALELDITEIACVRVRYVVFFYRNLVNEIALFLQSLMQTFAMLDRVIMRPEYIPLCDNEGDLLLYYFINSGVWNIFYEIFVLSTTACYYGPCSTDTMLFAESVV